MPNIKGPGEAQVYDGSDLRIAIVYSRWNSVIIDALVAGAKKSLTSLGVKEDNVVCQSVPGSYELPYAAQRIYNASLVNASSSAFPSENADLLSGSTSDISKHPTTTTTPANPSSSKPFDAVIAVGAVIKGDTTHDEYIATAVSQGLMRVQLDMGVPIVFGLLTVLTEEQGMARAGLVHGSGIHNHGEDWGRAAVELGVKRKGWVEGKIID